MSKSIKFNMDRVVCYCPDCDDLMEMDYCKGKWRCENCGKDLTKEVKKREKKK